MYTLHHYPICPLSRKVRVALYEKDLQYETKVQEFWKQGKELQKLNPMLSVPFLTAGSDLKIVGSQVIVEYLEEVAKDSTNTLFPQSPSERAEVRRIIFWFDDKFYHEVSKLILNERVYKYFRTGGHADQKVLNFARMQLPYHLKYLEFLLVKRHCLAGLRLTMADLSVASHLSSLDYFGEINWRNYPHLKDWYAVMKSRPSFRGILEDRIPGFKASAHYAELDF